jgi:ribosomal protein L27
MYSTKAITVSTKHTIFQNDTGVLRFYKMAKEPQKEEIV